MSGRTRVETIAEKTELSALSEPWNALEQADPTAHTFLSWPWMWGRLRSLHRPWRVLVVRHGRTGDVVGLLPLRRLGDDDRWGMAGSPLADYTGLLAAPGHEDEVLDTLADTLAGTTADWCRGLELADVHDPRVEALSVRLGDAGWQVAGRTGIACPYLELGPELDGDWDRFLARRVSASSRATIRRKLRRLAEVEDIRIASLAEGGRRSIETDMIQTLLTLWQGRWGILPPHQLQEYRSIFESCRQAGRLWIDIYRQGDTPITGLLAFLDHHRRWFGFYITGFDDRFAAYSPGTVIVAHSLRWALAEGFETFDFLRGDEPYKRSFGARVRHGRDLLATPASQSHGLAVEQAPSYGAPAISQA